MRPEFYRLLEDIKVELFFLVIGDKIFIPIMHQNYVYAVSLVSCKYTLN